MIGLLSHATQTLGVDVSDHILRAVLIESKKGMNVLRAYAEKPLDEGVIEHGIIRDPKKMQEQLSALFSRAKNIHPKKCTAIVGLPEAYGFIRTILVNEESLEKEIEKHLPFPYSEVTIDTLDHGFVEQQGKTLRLMSFAAIKTDVAESYYQTFHNIGVHVRALEIESQAFARLFTSEARDTRAIVIGDIGQNHTTFAIVQDGHIDFTHTSRLISGKLLTEEIQQSLHLSYAEAEKKKIHEQDDPSVQPIIQRFMTRIGKEIERVIAFHKEHAVSSELVEEYIVHLIGGGSHLHGIHAQMEQQIRYPVQHTVLPQTLILPSSSVDLFSYATAIGLAMRGFHPL